MMSSKPANQTPADTDSQAADDDELKNIERECYKALLGVVKETAAIMGITYTNIINMVALRYTFIFFCLWLYSEDSGRLFFNYCVYLA